MATANDALDAYGIMQRLMEQVARDPGDLAASGVFQFDIHGRGSTQFYLAREGNRPLELVMGAHPSPGATIRLDEDTLTELFVKGRDPRPLAQAGKLDLRGDQDLAAAYYAYVVRVLSGLDAQMFRIVEERVSKQPPRTSIERVHRPTQAMLDEAERTSQPMLITGAVDDWKALQWSFEGLKARSGNSTVVWGASSIPLTQFFDMIMSGSPDDPVAVRGTKLPDFFQQDIGPSPYFQDRYGRPAVWAGGAGYISRTHRDAIDGILVQCIGRKRFFVWAPEEGPLLSADKDFINGFQFAPIDPSKPDLVKYPQYAKARPLEFILNPGEAFFLPIGWWHWVQALDNTISVKFFPRREEFVAPYKQVLRNAG